ncbi:MAG: SUF system Fe-S cluster assembly regulator [Gammaproteobacteria bacterium]
MLRISKLADYATVILVFLAKHTEGVCNAKEIAKHTAIAVPTVSKLLKVLAGAGLLQSQRGATGGYRLACSAQDISVGQIIEVIEGDSGLTECSVDDGLCALEQVCEIRGNWQLINHAIQAALDSVSVADLAKPKLAACDINVSQIKAFASQEVKHGKDK